MNGEKLFTKKLVWSMTCPYPCGNSSCKSGHHVSLTANSHFDTTGCEIHVQSQAKAVVPCVTGNVYQVTQ